MLDTFSYNGYTVEIHADECHESPREWDNLSQIVCFHNRYNFGDKNDYSSEDFDGWESMKKQIIRDHNPVAIVPVYLFDHSGLSIATDCRHFQACDSHGWDWGQIGWAFVPREVALKEYSKKRISAKLRELAMRVLQGEVETYGQYISGEVYGYVIKNGEEEEIDSCRGMYGYDDTISEAKALLDMAN